MVQATLIASIVVALIAAYITFRYRRHGCTEAQTDFRIVASIVWLSLAALYVVAYFDGNNYLIRSGIFTRLSQITLATIYCGEILLGRAKDD